MITITLFTQIYQSFCLCYDLSFVFGNRCFRLLMIFRINFLLWRLINDSDTLCLFENVSEQMFSLAFLVYFMLRIHFRSCGDSFQGLMLSSSSLVFEFLKHFLFFLCFALSTQARIATCFVLVTPLVFKRSWINAWTWRLRLWKCNSDAHGKRKPPEHANLQTQTQKSRSARRPNPRVNRPDGRRRSS